MARFTTEEIVKAENMDELTERDDLCKKIDVNTELISYEGLKREIPPDIRKVLETAL